MPDEEKPEAKPPPKEHPDPNALQIEVNGETMTSQPGQLLIDACEKGGVYVPRFCYHPRMNPVGMCRVCLVEVDTGRGPMLMTSCTTPVAPEMKVDTNSEKVQKAQDGVLEFLLANHPLDCPVCDKGGECPLQDQTMAFGPGESRFVEEKRHFKKPIPVSSTVYLDRERCILCDRCTRFATDVAGDSLISFQGRGSHTEVNVFPEDPFNSYFSGNTVQICPVGALTAEPYRFKARPWDISEVVSTYPNPMGDRIALQFSRDEITRILGMDSEAVNHGWLSDRDRFSYQALSSENRLGESFSADGGSSPPLQSAGWSEALSAAASVTSAALSSGGPESVGVLGGARMTNEDQYLWVKLAKGVWGTDNVDAQLNDGLPPESVLSLPRAQIAEVCQDGGAVIFMSGDLKEEQGSLYLRLRQALQNKNISLVEMTPKATGLSDLASVSIPVMPGDLVETARQLVAAFQAGANDEPSVSPEIAAAAKAAAARPTTVVFGRSNLAEPGFAAAAAAHVLAEALPEAKFLPLLRRGNIMGALDMGMSPGFLPGRRSLSAGADAFNKLWGNVPEAPGQDSTGILSAAADGKIAVLYLLGADPLKDFPDVDLARIALEKAFVVMVDTHKNSSAAFADILLPAAGFGECEGSHTNVEGRITHLAQAITPPGASLAPWRIAAALMENEKENKEISLEAIWQELSSASALYEGVNMNAISEFDGVLTHFDGADSLSDSSNSSNSSNSPNSPGAASIPGETHETTSQPQDISSFRLIVNRQLYDQGTTVSESPALSGLAADAVLCLNPTDLDRIGIKEGSGVVETMRASLLEAGPLEDGPSDTGPAEKWLLIPAKADTGVIPRTAVIAFNTSGADCRELIEHGKPFSSIRIRALESDPDPAAATGAEA